MAALRPHPIPSISFNQLNEVTYLHAVTIVLSGDTVNDLATLICLLAQRYGLVLGSFDAAINDTLPQAQPHSIADGHRARFAYDMAVRVMRNSIAPLEDLQG